MELPDELLTLVRDFSRPVTRPDWRDLHRMDAHHFHFLVASIYNTKRVPVVESFVSHQTHFHYIFHLGFIVNAIHL